MRILVISNMYPSKKDTTYGTFVFSFIEQIRKYNQDGKTDCVVLKGRDGGRIRKIWKYISFYFSEILHLFFGSYDIVYVHTITYPIIPIRFVSLFRSLPLVFNVHGGDVLTHSALAANLKRMARPLMEKSLMVVSPSYYFKDVLKQEFPSLPEEKIYISPSGGIDMRLFSHQLKLNTEFTLGYVGRIDSMKGWDIFVKAIDILRKENIECKAIMAGRGKGEEQLIELIGELNLHDYIKFIGPVSHDQLSNVYKQMDLFVFPTCLKESLGLVGIEAMACGIPVVGSQIGGLQDYIKPNKNGYFFEPGNIFDLVDKIKKYIDLPKDKKVEMQVESVHTASRYNAPQIAYMLYRKLKTLVRP